MPPTHCAHCGYRLDKTDSPTCPECGTPREGGELVWSIIGLATVACRIMAIHWALFAISRGVGTIGSFLVLTPPWLGVMLQAIWVVAPTAVAVALWFAAPYLARRMAGAHLVNVTVAMPAVDRFLRAAIVLLGVYFIASGLAGGTASSIFAGITFGSSPSWAPMVTVAQQVQAVISSVTQVLVGILLIISHRPLVRLIGFLREWGAAKSD